MANERIDDIVAQEALDQIEELNERLDTTAAKFTSVAKTADLAKRTISTSSSMKELAEGLKAAGKSTKDMKAATAEMSATYKEFNDVMAKVDGKIAGLKEKLNGQVLAIEAWQRTAADRAESMKKETDILEQNKAATAALTAEKKRYDEQYRKAAGDVEFYTEAVTEQTKKLAEAKGRLESMKSGGAADTEIEAAAQDVSRYEAVLSDFTEGLSDAKDKMREYGGLSNSVSKEMRELGIEMLNNENNIKQYSDGVAAASKKVENFSANARGTLQELDDINSKLAEKAGKLAESGADSAPMVERLAVSSAQISDIAGEAAERLGEVAESQTKVTETLDAATVSQEAFNSAQEAGVKATTALKDELGLESAEVEKYTGERRKAYDALKDELAKADDPTPTETFRKRMREAREEMFRMTEQIGDLDGRMKQQKATMEQAAASAGKDSEEYKAEKEQYEEMAAEMLKLQEEIADAGDKAAQLTKMQKIANAEIQSMADPTSTAKAVKGAMDTVTGAFSTAISVTGMFSGSAEQLEAALEKVILIEKAANNVTNIYNQLKRTSALRIKALLTWRKLQIVHTKAQTGALAAEMAATNAQTGATARWAVATNAETGATVKLTVAQWALNAAMKANPIFLIIGAAAVLGGAIAGLIKLMGNAKEKQDELNRSVENNRRFAEVHNEARNSIAKEAAEMDRMVGKIKTAEKGSREWEQAVKFVSEKLGVSYKWLSDNVEKTEELAEAWRNVRLAQALDEKATEKAAEMMTGAIDGVEKFRQEIEKTGDIAASDKKIEKASEDLRDALGLTNEEVKRMYRESAAELVEARKTMTAEEGKQLSIWDIFQKKAANVAKEKGLEIIKQADDVTQAVKGDMKELENAQAQSAANISKYQSDQFASYAEYMAYIYKKNNELDKRNQLKTAAGTKAYWKDQMKHDLDMAWRHHQEMNTSQEEYERDKAAIIRTYNAQIQADTEKFNRKSAKQQETAAEYYKRILNELAAYEDKELTKSYRGKLVKLENQKQAELAKFKLTEEQKAAVERLYSIKRAELEEEEARRVQQVIAAAYAVQVETKLKTIEEEAKIRGVKGKELSDLLIRVENERYAQEEKNREEAFKKETEGLVEGGEEYVAIRKKYDALYEKAVFDHEAKLGDIRKSGIDQELESIRDSYSRMMNILTVERGGNAPSELEKLSIEAQMAKDQLDKFTEMTFPLDTIQRELDAGLMTYEDYAAQRMEILEQLGMTEEQYYNKLAEMQANAAESQKKYTDAQRDSLMASANSIAESFMSIGDSLSQLTGESLGMTIAMQSIAMAQVLANQAVAISAAIEKAMEDPTSMNVMMAIATATAAVAAVIAQVASAKSAIDQSKQALSNVNTYAEGTMHHPGGDAVVGEGGKPELIMAGRRSFIVDKPTLIKDLPVGAKVTPLDARTMDNYQQIDLTDVLASMDRIERKDRVHIDVGRNVYAYIVKGASRARVLNKQFSH